MNYYALIYETVDDYVARRTALCFPQKLTQSKKTIPATMVGRTKPGDPMDYYALIYETVDDYVARRAQFRELPYAFPQKPTQSKNNPRYNDRSNQTGGSHELLRLDL